MKKCMFTFLIAAAVLFTACSKDSIITDENNSALVAASASNGANTVRPNSVAAVISTWQTGYSWNVSDSADYKIYSHQYAAPDLTSDMMASGAVMVWIKNMPMEDGRTAEKPMLLPYHVLPSFGRPGYDQVWYAVSEPGSITLKFRTNKYKYSADDVPVPNDNIQFRFFMLPASELSKYNHTPSSITTLPYMDLVNMLQTAE